MNNNRTNRPRTTSKIDLANRPATVASPAESNEEARQQFLRLRTLQTRVMYIVWFFSAIAIGLYFANQILLAQVAVGGATLALLALCWVSYVRYKRNHDRREELLAHLDIQQDDQLRALFDEVRREKGLPPDASDKSGYTAEIEAERARIAAKTGEKDRIERLRNPNSSKKGSQNNGKQS